MPAELQELLEPRVKRLGYLGEFFQRAAHQPDALANFYRWTEALKTALPFRLVEVVALTVATQTKNDYERIQHERLALQGEMTREEIVAVEHMRPGTCATLSEQEVAAAVLARCAVDNFGRGCNSALLRLSRLIGEPGAVGCLMLVGRYVAHATMANAWDLRPPASSPFAEESDSQ
jgi:alkylhydroperoxidase/carboxymuconolactone decarboxylase family protein YurZ